MASADAGHRGQRRVQLVDARHRADLRELRGDLRVVDRVQRVLVLELRHEQREEAVLRCIHRCGAARRVGADAARGGLARPRWSQPASRRSSRSILSYWPSVSVFSSRFLAVFMTSTLVWYEREADDHVDHLVDHVHVRHRHVALPRRRADASGRTPGVRGEGSSTTPATRTLAVAPSPSPPGTAWNTTCRARYGLPSGPAALSALARLRRGDVEALRLRGQGGAGDARRR